MHNSLKQHLHPKPSLSETTAENVLVVPEHIIHQAEFALLIGSDFCYKLLVMVSKWCRCHSGEILWNLSSTPVTHRTILAYNLLFVRSV